MADQGGTVEPVNSKVPHLLLALVLAFAAFVQLTVAAKTVVENPVPADADAGEYFSYAYNLSHYGVYSNARTWIGPATVEAPKPDKLRSPGYPLFLLAAGVPEPSYAYLRRVSFLQAGLGILSVWLAYLIASSFLARPLALVAATLTAISPHLTMVSTFFLTESLFLFLLLASTLALLRAMSSGRWSLYALAGACWGLCSLVRPTAEFFPVLLLLLALALPRLRQYAKPGLLALVCFAAVLSPWIIRNQTVPATGPGLMVSSIAHGAYPGFKFQGRAESFAFPYRSDPGYQAHTKNLPTLLRHIGSSFVAEPARYASWYLIGKPYFFLSLQDVQAYDILIYPTKHNPYYESISFALMRFMTIWLHWPLMILALAALLLLAFRPSWIGLGSAQSSAARIVALLVAYAIALHMVAAPFPRYAIPFRPLIFALAFLPLQAAWLGLRRCRPST
jgi:4-amino-4-deoxy-L-arabinose transferase-like glycosyltransferase